jgi:hypothetical protein
MNLVMILEKIKSLKNIKTSKITSNHSRCYQCKRKRILIYKQYRSIKKTVLYMKYLKKFNEDNSSYKTDGIYIPSGESLKVEPEDMIGKIPHYISYNNDSITFVCSSETEDEIYYIFSHEQDCCEDVWLDDISGELDDLIGWPILRAEVKESKNKEPDPVNGEKDDSWTWTFYTLATISGYVDLKFFGTSNGYYSESIDVVRIIPEEKDRLYS